MARALQRKPRQMYSWQPRVREKQLWTSPARPSVCLGSFHYLRCACQCVIINQVLKLSASVAPNPSGGRGGWSGVVFLARKGKMDRAVWEVGEQRRCQFDFGILPCHQAC